MPQHHDNCFHVHFEGPIVVELHGDAQARPPWVDEIVAELGKLTKGVAIMAGELDTLEKSVQTNTDAEDSAVVLLGQLSALIKAGAQDPAKILALAAQLDQKKDALAAAIVANTPAA